jgi:hypothetical protein
MIDATSAGTLRHDRRQRRGGRRGAHDQLLLAARAPRARICPLRVVNIVAPTAQRSVRPSTSSQRARACSGAMKAGVPMTMPACVEVRRASARSKTLAMPKSSTFKLPALVMKQVLGLHVAVHDVLGVGRREHVEELVGDRQRLFDREPSPLPLPALLHRLAFEKLHDEERRPVRRDVVVEDADRALVLNDVRGVALLQESRAHLFVVAELFVEHLHRDALAVSMRRRIDGRHPADAEHRLETPLVLKQHADAPTRSDHLRVVLQRGLLRRHSRVPLGSR